MSGIPPGGPRKLRWRAARALSKSRRSRFCVPLLAVTVTSALRRTLDSKSQDQFSADSKQWHTCRLGKLSKENPLEN